MHRGYDGAGVSYTEKEVLPDFSGISTLSTGIVGGATRGPLKLTKITSAKKFRKIFGDPVEGDWGAYGALKVLKNSNCIWYKRVVSSQAAKGVSGLTGYTPKYLFETLEFDESLNGARVVVTQKKGQSFLNTEYENDLAADVTKGSGDKDTIVELEAGESVSEVQTVIFTKSGVSYEYTRGVDFNVIPEATIADPEGGEGDTISVAQIEWISRAGDTNAALRPETGESYRVVYNKQKMVQETTPDRYDVVLTKSGSTLERLTNFTLETDDVDNILTALGERSEYLKCVENTATGVDYHQLQGTYTIGGGNGGIMGLSDADYIGTEGTDEGLQAFLDPETLDISTLIVPGVFSDAVIYAATKVVEKRGDCMYIPDLPQGLSPQQADKFSRRRGDWTPTLANQLHLIDSKFVAMYYPWILEYVADFGKNVFTPPSPWVASQFAYNDTIAHTWFAPAGFQNVSDGRGILQSAIDVEHRCTAAERDILYADDNGCVNPIVPFSGKGITIWGNKTSLRCSVFSAADSSWTQVSVRRLCNYCRKCIIKASMETLFQPNTERYWMQWRAKVEQLLSQIKSQDGIEAYRVQMDRSTISDEDIYYGRAPGKVYIKPVHAIEWIPITFTVTHDSVIFTEGNPSAESEAK